MPDRRRVRTKGLPARRLAAEGAPADASAPAPRLVARRQRAAADAPDASAEASTAPASTTPAADSSPAAADAEAGGAAAGADGSASTDRAAARAGASGAKRQKKQNQSRAARARREAERRARIAFVLTRFRAGCDERAVLDELVADHAVDARQARRDLDAAHRELAREAGRRDPRDRRRVAVLQRDELVRRAFEKDDVRVALAALDSREKILDLLDPDADRAADAAQTLLEVAERARQAERDARAAAAEAPPAHSDGDDA